MRLIKSSAQQFIDPENAGTDKPTTNDVILNLWPTIKQNTAGAQFSWSHNIYKTEMHTQHRLPISDATIAPATAATTAAAVAVVCPLP